MAQPMRRAFYLCLGSAAVALGLIGVVVPGLPTVPFMLLAAFAFSRSSPRLEAWLVEHPRYGGHIRAWRASGAIARRAKFWALGAFGFSLILGWALLGWPWAMAPTLAAAIGGSWVWTRPEPTA